MFSRENRLDYQLFFSTRGAFRLLGWNGLLTVIVYLSIALVVILTRFTYGVSILVAIPVDMAMSVAIGQILSPGVMKLLSNPIRRTISLWSPLFAILLLSSCIPQQVRNLETRKVIYKNSRVRWILYLVLFLLVLLSTISRLRFPCIVKLVDSALSSKQLAWRQVILNLCMLSAIGMLVFTFSKDLSKIAMVVCQLCTLVVVSFGNFQIPAAIVRVVLALLRIVPQNYFADDSDGNQDSEKNLKPSLNIFYGMVLGQGILYIVACLLEVFSFIPRRYLVRHGGFKGQLGVEYVNLYYAYAFEKCMGGAVLVPKKISLITFAMDSLNSDSSRNKLYGVQMLHSFLKKEQLRAKTITKLTNATKTVASLFDTLGWTSDTDADIRLFAAKVIAELAGSLRVVQIPGATQHVTSLLDTDSQQRIKDHFLFSDTQEGKEDSPIQQVGMAEQNFPVLKYLKQMAIYCLIPVDEPSNMDEENSCMLRCWKRITKCWSVPEEPSTDQDFLPVQGLLILERLANFDPGNCTEISRATGLISKLIDFTRYRNHMTSTNEAHQIMLASLSLRVLRRLASTEGKLGVTLRQQILEHPFVLSNLAEIVDDDSGSSHELKQLAAEILKNLAMDRKTSEDIGRIRVIISSLMRAFLSHDPSSSTNSNHLLRKTAGQALAMLAMESTDNCLVMLMEPGYVLIRQLTTMIHDDRYKCIAASLLWNMCEHAQPELSNSDLKELSYILREALEGIMDAEGAELEVFIGLSSQICQVIPEDFAREVEHGQIKEKFVKRLVHVLNAHMRPSAHCPGIRRVIVQHAIYLMEFNSHYANDFHKCWMVEALSMVERTPSRSESYRLFSGDAGLMEHITPLSTLVARAKDLMSREWVRDISTMANTTGGEHSVQIRGEQVEAGKMATPEKRLNRFVRLLALMERTGNALGTLAFTWATVVLLGGYPAELGSHDDFWFATAIVFLEAISHCRYGTVSCNWHDVVSSSSETTTQSASPCHFALEPIICNPIAGYVYTRTTRSWFQKLKDQLDIIVLVPSTSFVCPLTNNQQAPVPIKLLPWCQVILNMCMLAAIVMLVFIFSEELSGQLVIIVFEVSALLLLSFGNFQIPAASVRVVLAFVGILHAQNEGKPDNNKINLKASLIIFYGMVLGQGILYIVACLLEVLSFIPRRYLIRHGGLGGQMGVEYVNLYYADAFEKCMGGAVLAPKKISLITFAMDSLNSDSSRKKLYGVQMLHKFLKKDQLRTKTITKLTNDTKTVASLFDMLDWTSDGDEEIRLFAAKVTAELAGSLRVVQIPGATQHVTSLLDTDHQQKTRDHFLFIDSQVGREDSPIPPVGMGEQNSPVLKYLKQMAIYCLIPVDEPSNVDEQNSCMLRCWKRITKCWSVPEEEPSTDQDFLPVQGLLILERLANFDPGNCTEISRATGLISKLIDFTRYRNHMTSTNEAHQIMLASLSLRVLRRLASTEGKLGVTLRQQILEHPFVLSNLAEIVDDDSGSSHELKQLAAEILKNLAMDRKTSKDIGRIRVIISSLMRAFLSHDPSSSTNSNHLLRETAGQALAMLAMESTDNCLVMLMEPGYVLIRQLTTMIHDDRYKCIAASLFWNMCEHAQPELSNSDLKELSYILREVLEGIMEAEGAELEVLIGLSSQICQVIPEDFAREVQHGQIKEKFVKRLVHVLNAHMRPSAHCPGIRRVIVRHAIYLMEFNSRYANDFHKCWMVEALSMIERTPSRSENYRLFSGDTGLMEHNTPLSTLVARAKELMGREWVRGISSKCMRGPVLAPKKISLITFAMDSLNSDSSKNKLYGEKLRIKTITKLTNGTKTVASLFDLLGWTSNADADIRLCAAKVTADLAGSARVVQIPGARQLIASLLDIDQQPKISNHFLFIESQEGREDSPVQQVGMGEHNSMILKYLKKMAIYCLIPVDEPSNIHEQNPHILRCWRWITRCWSIPEEELSTDQDSLPVQGLLILERLVNFDLGNCMEISRAPGLILKMIDFTSYTFVNEETPNNVLSLRVLRTLASTKGKSGVSLRQRILENLFLLSNLAEILDDRESSHVLKQLAAEILKNLTMDRNTSEDIGHIRLIIRSLMREFFSRDASFSTNSNHLLQKIAGQALVMLAMERANNCLIMLMEPGYVFIKELTTLIHDERYKYTAESMLWNMCEQARTEFSNSDLKELSYTLREIKEKFVKRLVNALNANKRPSAHCPSIRRVTVQHGIYLMEFNSCYANDFCKCGMVEALSMVEVKGHLHPRGLKITHHFPLLWPEQKSLWVVNGYGASADSSSTYGVVVAMANTTAGGEQYTASSRGKRKVAAPEKQLNRFVHLVAVTERLGNALGTLAFTWATVVLLGGYPTVLRPGDDFWMFSRDNRLDYQLFFSTRGAFRLLGWNGLLTVIVYYSAVLRNGAFTCGYGNASCTWPDAVSRSSETGKQSGTRRNITVEPITWSHIDGSVHASTKNHSEELYDKMDIVPGTVSVRLLNDNQLRFPCIVQLVGSVLSRRQLAWRRLILNLSMLAAIVMLVFTFDKIQHQVGMMVYQVSALLVVSFGNFQIPAAVVRVVLALIRLLQQNYVSEGDNGQQDGLENLNPSLNIFYGMVLGQGSLYIMACILEIFSFIPRRSLIRHGGFKGRQGVEYANLYYAYAFEKCMGGNVFAPKNISIVTFAMDSLNSDSSRKKLYGVQMLHSFLKKEHLRAKTIPKLTNSTKTVASLFNMLGWTSDGDADVRLFAAKVTAELAGSLRVVAIPGAMQNVASLLQTDHQPKIRNHFLFSDNQEAREDSVIQQVGMVKQNSPVIKYWKQMAIYLLIPVDEPSNIDEMNLSMLRCWRWIKKYWSIPEEEPFTDQDFLPVQGLIILERLASFDPGNCIKISRVTGLISKMIDFTSYRNHMTSIKEAHQIMLAVLSLRVLRALVGTKGKLGVTLRQQILEHPFLLRNLAEILDDSGSNHELRVLAAEIIKHLSMEKNTSEDIGQFRVIISSFMRAFLSQDSNHLLRKITGQALAMLAMESANNCLVMLMEPGFVFVKELTTMIHDDRYKYTAASLLRSLCEHARPELNNSDLMELSCIIQEVLEGLMDAEGAELEVLIGLSSQICIVVPDDFARALEHSQIKKKFEKRLVGALNAHLRPNADCPGIRRVIVQHAICLMEFDSRYAYDFHKCWMVEALSMVENTSTRLENYRLFSGDVGLMEHGTPLSTLVARAKELMGREWVQEISTAT
uniref:Uncharacterized protein n=1 Tax=Oryza punctata TaxID=4537 RepID=A0A0E0LP62_ORYPU